MTAPIRAYRLDGRRVGYWCAACVTVHTHGGFGMRASHCVSPASPRYRVGIVLRCAGAAAESDLRPELVGLVEALSLAGDTIRAALIGAIGGAL